MQSETEAKKEEAMYSSTTTQPTMAEPAKTRVQQFFEAVRLIMPIAERVRHRWQKRPVDELTRDEHIRAFVKGLKCNCDGGSCDSCQHRIKDVFGD